MSGFTPFAGRRIAVVGLGKAGLPAALRLREWGAAITVWDDKENARAEAERAGLTVAEPVAGGFDTLLLSPGIPHIRPRIHPAAEAARACGAPIVVDVELLFEAVRASGSQARFAGITGTNGKSTTTALLGHILEQAGVPVAVGGNLGTAALSMPVLPDNGVYVLEMSSYMLERIAHVRFNTAVMLNLSLDHIDRHGDMAGYRAAKLRIFASQTPDDLALLGDDDAMTAEVSGLVARTVHVSGEHACPGGIWAEAGVLRDDAGVIMDLATAPTLPGAHNAQNAAAAAAMALHLGVPRAGLPAAIRSYPGLPHRHEQVGVIRGVRFVNDSKATNADSTARALASHAKVVWIAGGTGKEGGIEPLVPWFGRIAHAFLIGRDGPEFAATLAREGVPHTVLDTLEQALPAAAEAAWAGAADIVLLSPAAASWDQFTGFDQRGDRFRTLVQQMGAA